MSSTYSVMPRTAAGDLHIDGTPQKIEKKPCADPLTPPGTERRARFSYDGLLQLFSSVDFSRSCRFVAYKSISAVTLLRFYSFGAISSSTPALSRCRK